MTQKVEITTGLGLLTAFSFFSMLGSFSASSKLGSIRNSVHELQKSRAQEHRLEDAINIRLAMPQAEVEKKDAEILGKVRKGQRISPEEFNWLMAKDRVESTYKRIETDQTKTDK